jgi:threonyl-tRNA synthetase
VITTGDAMNDAQPSERLQLIRHSLAHVLAHAVLQMRPGTKLGFGPATDDGFYYDFALSAPLTPEDFPEIERRMRTILGSGQRFIREELSAQDALARLAALQQPYKREYAAELLSDAELTSLTFYRSGDFVDMCEGPHVTAMSELPKDGFKLRGLAGAYWRADASKLMMTRVQAWAFESAEELAAHERDFERAALCDHKKLGRELELFTFDDEIGAGLPLWLPHGTVIRDELEKLMQELEFDAGFERVATPHIARVELYQRTGHLPYYAAGMFPFMQNAAEPNAPVFALKPMNCPHHHKIFAAKQRSYRELPFRISEYGHVYRYEDSGAVSGLLRTRCMCMNDAHIYCSPEQVLAEIEAVLAMHAHVYRVLGLSKYRVRLSTRGPLRKRQAEREKFVNDDAGWERSERVLREVLEANGSAFFEGPGEAAFYGPKIDFQFRMVTGREETASTVQLDFAMAQRLDLAYVAADGAMHRPLIIHRAPLGTHERFVALLIERFGGAFPTWLAPVQVRVIPVSAAQDVYAREVQGMLRARRVRAELDPADESLNKRVRLAAVQKVPNVLVVGAREQTQRTVSLRRYGVAAQQVLPVEALVEQVLRAIATRASAD